MRLTSLFYPVKVAKYKRRFYALIIAVGIATANDMVNYLANAVGRARDD